MYRNPALGPTRAPLLRALVTTAVVLAGTPCLAKNLYVSPNGNDAVTWAANSPTTPWKTLTRAGAMAQPGDTVLIAAGTYSNQALVVANSGTSSARIVFKTWSGTKDVTVTGKTIYITGKSYITIQDLIVQDVYQPSGSGLNTAGISLVGPSAGVTIVNNTVRRTSGPAIEAWGADNNLYVNGPYDYKGITFLTIRNNIIQDAVLNGWNEAITIARGVDNFKVIFNTLSRSATITNSNGGEAIDVKDGASYGIIAYNTITNYHGNMIYLDGGAPEAYRPKDLANQPVLKDIYIYNNRIHNNKSCKCNAITLTSEGYGSIHGVEIYNNLIYQNGNSAVTVYAHSAMKPSARIRNVAIANNSFYENGRFLENGQNWSADIDIDTTALSNPTQNVFGLYIYNNAGFKTGWPRRGISADQRVVSVIAHGSNSDRAIDDKEYTLTESPYINAGAEDFRLKPGSSGVDAGVSTTSPGVPAYDFTGAARPKGRAHDIGAYETY